MQCPQCHQENPLQARFCLACGVRLALTCGACGTELPAGARFCLACGQPVHAPDAVQSHSTTPVAYTPKHLADKILTSRGALQGERKQVTVRPGYRPLWLEKSYAIQIALRRLTSPDSLAVIHAVLQRVLPDPLAQVILDKAEGNPFFLEELTRAVVEHGDLRSLPAVPDTIQGVLMARIDRLPEEPKRLLQTASILGQEFSPRLLGALWDTPDVLEGYLAELKRLEFLYERPEAAEPVYVFKHVLTQEVAYDTSSPPAVRPCTPLPVGPWRASTPIGWRRSMTAWRTTMPGPLSLRKPSSI